MPKTVQHFLLHAFFRAIALSVFGAVHRQMPKVHYPISPETHFRRMLNYHCGGFTYGECLRFCIGHSGNEDIFLNSH